MTTLKSIALQFHTWGANINAIGNNSKSPLNKWADIQFRRQERREVEQLPWRNAAGVGVMNGPSGWRTLELDAMKVGDDGKRLKPSQIVPVDEAVLVRLLRALGLPDDYQWTWRSGSGSGWEIAVICHGDIPGGMLSRGKEAGVYTGEAKDATEFEHIEIRYEKSQTIYPPSAYADPDGPGYIWRGEAPTEAPTAVTVGHIINAFFAVAVAKRQVEEPKPAPQTTALKERVEADDEVMDQIRDRFDLVAYAIEKYGGETKKEPNGEIRVCGHGGLLINVGEKIWNIRRDEVGGDCFELVGYHLYGDSWNKRNGTMFYAAKVEAAAFAGVNLPQPQHPKPQFAVSPDGDDVVTISRAEYERMKGFEAWVTDLVAVPGERLSPAAKLVALSLRPKMDSMTIWKCEEPQRVYIGNPKIPDDDGAAKRAGLSADTYSSKLQELADVGAITRETRRNAITGNKQVFVKPDNFFDPANWIPPEARTHGGHHPKNNRPAPDCSTHGADAPVFEQTTIVKQRYCGVDDCQELLGEPVMRRTFKTIWDPNNPDLADEQTFESADDVDDPNSQLAVSTPSALGIGQVADSTDALEHPKPQFAVSASPLAGNNPFVDPATAPGVRSGAIDADDSWFALQRALQGKAVTP